MYYLKEFLEESKCIIKKKGISKYISNDLEISSENTGEEICVK